MTGAASWKSNSAFRLFRGFNHPLDGLKDGLNLLALFGLGTLEFVHLSRQILVGSQDLPQPDKGSHNGDVDLDRAFAVQDG
jgi:hypothetical protein